jgi:16S rRNA U516 pseudouridylate synthase RsuA-like enzyme
LEKDWHYILGDSDSKLLIVATEAIYEKVKDYVGKVGAALLNLQRCSMQIYSLYPPYSQIGKVQSIICLDAPADKPYSYKA